MQDAAAVLDDKNLAAVLVDEVGKATPLSEVQAAGLVLLSGWDRKSTLYDPMCGSGTIAIEAALIANNIAPGLIRNQFGFQKWKDYDAALFNQLMEHAAAAVNRNRLSVVGSDIISRNIVMAIKHAGNAIPDNTISFFTKAFEDAEPPRDKGILIINPPYGERLQPEDIIEFYKMIGNVLKRKYAGFTAWVFSSNAEAAKFIGLKPSMKVKLKNGPLDCLFLKFEIRDGKFVKNHAAEQV
jgi:putative N6-adenine-specific DNA methylase